MDKSIGDGKTLPPDGGAGGASHAYALKPGDILGQYRIIAALGAGGMGEVYLVEHGILRTRHALKVLPAERADSPGFLERFRDEARVMAQLQHPGIVHVQYADVTDGRHYLVMNFVGCGDGNMPLDLEDALADAPAGRLPPAIVVRLMLGVCEAVGYAHGRGVVHRDLKPANVLLTDRDPGRATVRVTDFGLARLVGEEWLRSVIEASLRQSMSIGDLPTTAQRRESRSSSGSILGTYDYMSPEQRDGRDADARSDVYAVGVMLYRLLTGKRLRGRAKAASKLVAGLDPNWDALIDSCLEEDPANRPGSMTEVAAHLQGLLEDTRKKDRAAAEAAVNRQREADERVRERARQVAEADARRQKQVTRPAAVARERWEQADGRARETRPTPPPPIQKKRPAMTILVWLVAICAVASAWWGVNRDHGRHAKVSPAPVTKAAPSSQSSSAPIVSVPPTTIVPVTKAPATTTVRQGSGLPATTNVPARAETSAIRAKNTRPTVEIDTSLGMIEAELYDDQTPLTVANFLKYTKDGFYEGTIFHRVINGFMIQGGGYDSSMKLKPTRAPIRNEARSDLQNKRGTLAMARTVVVNSATSQFFINLVDNGFLDHRDNSSAGAGYCVFGKVTKGMEIVDAIAQVETGSQDVPRNKVVIEHVRVLAPVGAEAVEGQSGTADKLNDEITETASGLRQ